MVSECAARFLTNVRQKKKTILGMSETVSCTQLILHLDLRLGIIRYLFFISRIRLTMEIKRMGREGGWLIRGWRLVRENTSLNSQQFGC